MSVICGSGLRLLLLLTLAGCYVTIRCKPFHPHRLSRTLALESFTNRYLVVCLTVLLLLLDVALLWIVATRTLCSSSNLLHTCCCITFLLS